MTYITLQFISADSQFDASFSRMQISLVLASLVGLVQREGGGGGLVGVGGAGM